MRCESELVLLTHKHDGVICLYIYEVVNFIPLAKKQKGSLSNSENLG